MSEQQQIDDPSIKLLETLRKRDKLQAPVERETASFLVESENLLEKEALEDPFDDLERAVDNEISSIEPDTREEVLEEGSLPHLPADVEESKIQKQFFSKTGSKSLSIVNKISIYLKRWITGEQQVIGIDINGNTLSVVKISNKLEGKTLTEFVSCEIIGDTGAKRSKDIIDALKTVMSDKTFKNGNVVISISGPNTAIKQFVLPKLTGKEIQQAVKWQAQKNLPFKVEDSVYDYFLNPDAAGDVTPVTIVAAENKYLNDVLSNYKKSDVKIKKISPTPFALLDILQLSGKDDGNSSFVIIDIGWDRMTITFISKGLIQFIRDVPVGVSEIVDGLQGSVTFRDKTAVINELMAKRLLEKYGIPLELIDSFTDENSKINSISQQMSGAVDRIVEEVNRSLNYFKRKFPEIDDTDIIYLSGQGADLYNMGLLLRRTTRLQVERINPLLGLNVEKSSASISAFNKVASSLAVATGLARNLFKGPNIAPDDAKIDITFGVVKKAFAIGIVAIAFILSALTLSVSIELEEKKDLAKSAELALASLSPIQQQYLSSSKETGTLRELMKIMNDEDRKTTWFRSQLNLLSALSPPEMMMSHIDIRTSVSKTDQDKGVSFVQLTGAIFADDFFSKQIVRDYQDALKSTNLFTNVEVTESNLAGSGNTRAMFFVINCFL
ncbi:MAG: pilus assembly protein PilM [Candidatus Marinimicrobia bacterium]|nr:pilus assembly protein PilM [Candidatus Neomarinimicrobiota bacterium]